MTRSSGTRRGVLFFSRALVKFSMDMAINDTMGEMAASAATSQAEEAESRGENGANPT